jgi:hypothetical protein
MHQIRQKLLEIMQIGQFAYKTVNEHLRDTKIGCKALATKIDGRFFSISC